MEAQMPHAHDEGVAFVAVLPAFLAKVCRRMRAGMERRRMQRLMRKSRLSDVATDENPAR